MATSLEPTVAPRLPQLRVPRTDAVLATKPVRSEAERRALRTRIKRLLHAQDAVLIAHYYTDGDLQDLAEETGGTVSDSLEMARFGRDHPASTLVVAGVRFMAETAKILSPNKRVLAVDRDATCSLDESCPPEAFAQFRAQHPERTVVVYANTSAAVKAQADWVVTSSIALGVAAHLHEQGEPILWAPDKHLGRYVQERTKADMVLWDGACVVHEEFKAIALQAMKRDYPDAAVLAHPEAPWGLLEQADFIGSTTQLLEAAQAAPQRHLIVATDDGLFHKMRTQNPEKVIMAAPTAGAGATCRSCAHCPWMAMNELGKLCNVLESGDQPIEIEPQIRQRALRPLERMVEFKTHGRSPHGRQIAP